MINAHRSVTGRRDGAPERTWSLDFVAARVFAAVLALAVVAVPGVSAAALPSGPSATVIVRAAEGYAARAEQRVIELGGRVLRELPIIDGFSASLPSAALPALLADASIVSVTPDETLRPMAATYAPGNDLGSMYNVTLMTGAQTMWRKGHTGKGVDVAIIDSGLVPVDELEGRIINGPDLSFESQSPQRRHLDTYGHGTHLAGIIAGRGSAAVDGRYAGDKTNFLGMAPDARLVSIKVADAHGNTDVSQVIAAIGWVVQHKDDDGMNIRVLNLSYGTNSTQSYKVDPLAYAAEVAWRKGIVVVTAAGNAGFAEAGSLTNPAFDPWLLAVGSSDHKGTVSTWDDRVSLFSSSSTRGDDGTYRMVDIVAPGQSVVSLRVPGSFIDRTYGSTGAVSDTLFRGSGTSQSAAVVSGAAALVLDQRPDLEPDEVKRLLTRTASRIDGETVSQGSGELDLTNVSRTPDKKFRGFDQSRYLAAGTGTGSLEAARGTNHLVMDGVVLRGEQDIFGAGFDSAGMAAAQASGDSWSGGVWNGNSWSGNSWSGNSWSGNSWSGDSWSGNSWSGNSWSNVAWNGNSWSSDAWSGDSWSGNSWSNAEWSSNSWSSAGWE